MTTRGQLAFTLMTMGVLALTSGCASTVPPATWDEIAARAPAPTVTAAAETQAVATANADAADDPAIWRNAANPAASLIVATDKRAGLNVYDVTGRLRSAVPAGRVNNVDLVDTPGGIIVAASDRNDAANAKIALFRLDAATATLVPLGSVSAGAGEAYGICMASRGAAVDVFMVIKDGTIRQIALDLAGAAPTGRVVRTMKLATQSEGCVVDAATNALFVAEEDVGVWRFDARPDGGTTPTMIAKVDGTRLVADVEGVTIANGLLLVSSQGDNAYAAYDVASGGYVGRFRIAAGSYGATSETDGIAAAAGDFGSRFPEGVFVAQDGDNAPAAQNFKLVDWREARRVLGR